MQRTDFVTSREDVIKNIKTLYAYAQSKKGEYRDWAEARYAQGRWFVVEKIEGQLYFAPSLFVGYKNNSWQKHNQHQGDGRDTNKQLDRKLKLYSPDRENKEPILRQFEIFLTSLGFPKKYMKNIQFYIPRNLKISDLGIQISDIDVDADVDANKTSSQYTYYIELLKSNKNLILTGAPGTGKTHLAKAIAKAMNAEIGFVQFHPSYDYTDFVEGLRPTPPDANGNIGFKRVDGIFKAFCKRAIKSREKTFVFIIDEINRGEISKIFGELFFSIDPGYRGEKGQVKTQYQNLITDETDSFYDGFYVPENVYIIGTMNDIDRSVESMDFAMRRRFAWQEIKANENTGMLGELGSMKAEVMQKMQRLNAKIEEIEGLNSSYHIGGAYFCKLSHYLKLYDKQEAYTRLWENHLQGLLFEYLRGMANAKEHLERLRTIYFEEDENNQPER